MLPFHFSSRRHALPSSIERLEARIAPATLTVKNLLGTGPDSLHDLVQEANDTPGEDIIVFAPGLRGSIPFTDSLYITDSLQILGPQNRAITLDGMGHSRIFAVTGAELEQGTNVTFSHLKFTRGVEQAGGALLIANGVAGSVTIEDCDFTGNRATGTLPDDLDGPTGALGGAVYVGTGRVFVNHSRFTGNSAISATGLEALGGAIYSLESELTIHGSTFSGNLARGGDAPAAFGADEPAAGGAAYGGAIYSDGSLVLEGGTIITKNQAIGGQGGAGEHGLKGDGLGGAGFTGYNGSEGGRAEGGGICSSGFLSLSHTTVSKNLAQAGDGGAGGRGGEGADGTKRRAEDDGFGNTFYYKYAPGEGGSGGNGGQGGEAWGGGISQQGSLFFGAKSLIADNTARGGHAGAGGAIGATGRYVADDLAPADFGSGLDSPATPGYGGFAGTASGGGLYYFNFAGEDPGFISDSTISGNVAKGGNGLSGANGYKGLRGFNGSEMEDGYVGTTGGNGQDAIQGGFAFGGGIHVEGSLSILHSTIAKNSALGGNGGKGGNGGDGGAGGNRGPGGHFRGEGGYGGSGGAGGDGGFASGGGISAALASLDVQDSSILSNSAVSGLAGKGGAKGKNGAAGAGPRNMEIDPEFDNLPVRGNDGARIAGGGGVSAGDSWFVGCTIAYNKAVGGVGGGLYLSPSSGVTAQVYNSTIVGNSAKFGGGIGTYDSSVYIYSTISAGNVASEGGADVLGTIEGGNNLFGKLDFLAEIYTTDGFADSIIGGAGLGKLGLNGAAAGSPLTFALKATSKAINNGANPGELLADARGFAREQGDGVDIGAVEFGQKPAPQPPEDPEPDPEEI